MAHAAVVRQRRASLPDAVTAVLSVNARATALTILRGSVVLVARELPWGHETERAEQAGAGIDPNRFARNLASELRRSFVCLRQTHKAEVTHVLVCGDVPDMRSLTGPLMHELGVEVETLDAIEDFDLSRIPDSADEFRSRLAALRTAWALAADATVSVNLLPREGRAGGIRTQDRTASWLRGRGRRGHRRRALGPGHLAGERRVGRAGPAAAADCDARARTAAARRGPEGRRPGRGAPDGAARVRLSGPAHRQGARGIQPRHSAGDRDHGPGRSSRRSARGRFP